MDVYELLAEHLNSLPSDVAADESAIDSQLLRELFGPDEAKIVRYLTLEPLSASVIASLANMDDEKARQYLADMAERGLIFSACKLTEKPPCAADQYLIGLWRFMEDDWRPGHGRVPAFPV